MDNRVDAVRFDVIKKGLRSSLIPFKEHEKMLDKVPHKRIEDMALIYKIERRPGDESSRFIVTSEMVKRLDMDNKQFMEAADRVIPENEPPFIGSITDALGIYGGAKDRELLFVATTAGFFEGAGVIDYKGFLDKAADFLQGDFIVLPSSIHEVLLLKDNGNLALDELRDMVQTVNRAVVDPKEQLSDQVYHYDSRNKVFELAEKFEERRSHDREGKDSVLKELRNGRDKANPTRTDKTRKPSQEAR